MIYTSKNDLNFDAVLPGYPIPNYLYVGQEVIAPLTRKSIISGKVLVACGDCARVVNEEHGYDRWVDRYYLRVKE